MGGEITVKDLCFTHSSSTHVNDLDNSCCVNSATDEPVGYLIL